MWCLQALQTVLCQNIVCVHMCVYGFVFMNVVPECIHVCMIWDICLQTIMPAFSLCLFCHILTLNRLGTRRKQFLVFACCIAVVANGSDVHLQ